MDNKTWIIIGLLTVLVIATILLFNQFSLTGNIVRENSIDANLNDGTEQSTYKEPTRIYATLGDLDVKLERRSFAKIHGLDENLLCSNGWNSFDLWIELSLRDYGNRCDSNGVQCVSYSCTSELTIGEDTHLYKNTQWTDYDGGYDSYSEGWAAFSQLLKRSQEVRVCCESSDSDASKICKTAYLNPYC